MNKINNEGDVFLPRFQTVVSSPTHPLSVQVLYIMVVVILTTLQPYMRRPARSTAHCVHLEQASPPHLPHPMGHSNSLTPEAQQCTVTSEEMLQREPAAGLENDSSLEPETPILGTRCLSAFPCIVSPGPDMLPASGKPRQDGPLDSEVTLRHKVTSWPGAGPDPRSPHHNLSFLGGRRDTEGPELLTGEHPHSTKDPPEYLGVHVALWKV